MKARNVIDTRRPLPGQGAFVHAAAGLAPIGLGMNLPARASFAPAGYGWADRAEGQVHPGEGSA